jgi:hypothetical protein
MKARFKSARLMVNDKPVAAIGVMCGERLFRLHSWRTYPIVWKPKGSWGIGVGPLLFWNGD